MVKKESNWNSVMVPENLTLCQPPRLLIRDSSEAICVDAKENLNSARLHILMDYRIQDITYECIQ